MKSDLTRKYWLRSTRNDMVTVDRMNNGERIVVKVEGLLWV